MSKILVDEMPRSSIDCPFSKWGRFHPDTYESNAYYEYMCFIEGARCRLECGMGCHLLKELPKGDKKDGSEED